MNEKIKNAITEYQCCGCTNGPAMTCYKKADHGYGCEGHYPGTIAGGIGTILLGMPKGFDRVGPVNWFRPQIFEKYEQGKYDMYNIPVWKHLDENGHTMVRGLSPRINQPFLHIFLEDCRDKVDCLEITKKEQEGMD